MPSLYFVCDAQGHPLMPMSAAYGRTLLQQGKAYLRPHPVFTIVELTQVVGAPTLRPVLVGFTLHGTTASLRVMIDQARTLPASFSIVVELPIHSRSISSRRRRWQPQKTRVGQIIYALAISQLRHIVSVLSSVIDALHQLIPISHWAVLPPQAQGTLTMLAHRRMRRLLKAEFVSSYKQQSIHEIDISSVDGITSLAQTVQNFLMYSTYPPVAVACINHARQPRHAFIRSPNIHLESNDSKHVHQKNIGKVCTIRTEARTFTGIVSSARSDDRILVQVPTMSSGKQLQWRLIAISARTPIRIWPSSGVALLPLTGLNQL